mmetsp:Transcript_29369/g.87049  ORF Transcript_29369/g.87049 Transcript_29369/m.87049 type:complete len:99 (+) Transcript_29369:1257-1553(+)
MLLGTKLGTVVLFPEVGESLGDIDGKDDGRLLWLGPSVGVSLGHTLGPTVTFIAVGLSDGCEEGNSDGIIEVEGADDMLGTLVPADEGRMDTDGVLLG